MHADGAIAEAPIALVEVPGYVYEAKLRIADVYEALGDAPAPIGWGIRTPSGSSPAYI